MDVVEFTLFVLISCAAGALGADIRAWVGRKWRERSAKKDG